MNKNIRELTKLAVVAALYVAMSLVLGAFSYGAIQVRLSEMLALLVLIDKKYLYAITLGCAIANFFSPLGIVDVIVGTLTTFISLLMIIYLAPKFKKMTSRVLMAISVLTFWMWPIALELHYIMAAPFWMTYLTTMIGEFISTAIGGIIFLAVFRNKLGGKGIGSR